jgi:hypothetical protein
MNEAKIVLEKITEADRTITFNPPLVVEIYQIEKDGEEFARVEFDFGMVIDLNYLCGMTFKTMGDWTVKTRLVIEFELFHSFHHLQEDPNYNTLNWALFGNLAHRVECSEDWSFDGMDIEKWKYTKDFRRTFE